MPTVSPAPSTTPPRPADLLSGIKLDGGWEVGKRLSSTPGGTGGNFSVGYIVKHADGREAFLKALDYSLALRAADPARELQILTAAYNFERDILAKCRDMNRVVTAIADGSVAVPTPRGNETVQYLILEKADSDSRALLSVSASFDVAWSLRALHHLATGLRQMHDKNLAHQDLKPSNVLVFNKHSSKIGDVGRAAEKGVSAPHENLSFAGDPAYAPIESLYGHIETDWNARRMGCDCYLLGSMMLFFFTNLGTTPAILSRMLPTQHPSFYLGPYQQILPFVRNAFDQVANDFENSLHADLRKDLPVIFRQLCDPDPTLRGHPAARASIGNSYSVDRYINRFDNLARRAESNMFK